jgi:hypothetical protein
MARIQVVVQFEQEIAEEAEHRAGTTAICDLRVLLFKLHQGRKGEAER